MAVSVSELSTVAALQHLCPECLTSLAQVMIQRTYAPGEYIFFEGDEAGGIWFVLKGQVRILKLSASGRTQLLCRMNAGKCFGTCPLFNSEINPANAQAIDEVTLFILPRQITQDMLHSKPDLVHALLQIYSQRVSQLARLSECLGTWSAPQRLNDCLLTYADAAQPYPQVHMTHEQLAEAAGTVREVASRHLTKLEQAHIVHLKSGCITLLDREALKIPCIADQR